MNKVIYIFLQVIICLPIYGQQDTKLNKQIEALRLEMIDPTREGLDKLVLDKLSYGHSSGIIDTKAKFIEDLLNGNSDFSEINLTDQSAIIHGKTAIVRYNMVGKTLSKNKTPGVLNIHVMTTWVKEGKNWKLLGRQALKRV